MKHYKIADIPIAMECMYQPLLKQAEPYAVYAEDPVSMTIHISNERLIRAGRAYPHLTLNECEYILSGCDFCSGLLDYDGFCLHASAVSLENKAVLFSGPCGTGKSTHTSLWQQYFGKDRAVIINDDKPALRLIEDTFYVYGTPWSGKSDLNLNIKVPLKAIVFLKQAKENRIRRLNNREAVKMLIYQSLRPNNNVSKIDKLLKLLDSLLRKTPVYQMDCTISTGAVKLVYDTIYNERM